MFGPAATAADFVVGQVREQCIDYLGRPLRALWTKHFGDWKATLDLFHGDAAAARQRADTLDARVSRDARAAGGERYEGLRVLLLHLERNLPGPGFQNQPGRPEHAEACPVARVPVRQATRKRWSVCVRILARSRRCGARSRKVRRRVAAQFCIAA
ncbi:MAG TPA: DUF5127 domain-containing protein [Rhodanobacter sp.]